MIAHQVRLGETYRVCHRTIDGGARRSFTGRLFREIRRGELAPVLAFVVPYGDRDRVHHVYEEDVLSIEPSPAAPAAPAAGRPYAAAVSSFIRGGVACLPRTPAGRGRRRSLERSASGWTSVIGEAHRRHLLGIARREGLADEADAIVAEMRAAMREAFPRRALDRGPLAILGVRLTGIALVTMLQDHVADEVYRQILIPWIMTAGRSPSSSQRHWRHVGQADRDLMRQVEETAGDATDEDDLIDRVAAVLDRLGLDHPSADRRAA